MAQLREVFDFDALKKFLSRKDFKMIYDAMHAVTGPYAQRILVQVGAVWSVRASDLFCQQCCTLRQFLLFVH